MAKPSHFNDAIVEQSVHCERDRFIQRLRKREAELLQLASSSCNKTSASFFQPPAHSNYFVRGSYNLCFFIQFSDLQKCVLRIPLRPCLTSCPGRKVQSEVATMRCLAENTTIPVPKVLAYSTDDNSDPFSTFIILDYIDGCRLSSAQMDSLCAQEREELYKSLADMYIQLRRLEFSSIGRLEQSPNGFEVRQKTASIDMNMQQLEGLDPFTIQNTYHDKHGYLRSANAYANMLLDIGYNAFFKSRHAIEIGMGRDAIYHHYLFYQHAKRWVNPALDGGPFVLVHGDLHPSNLIVNEKMSIIGVLDWEWSRVVPVQFFVPPLWLTGRNTVELAGHNTWQLFLIKAFNEFLSILESRERDMYGNPLLSQEWAEQSMHAEPLIANALENWTDIDWFAFRYLSRADEDATKEAIQAFIDEDPLRRLVAEMKEKDECAYSKELAAVMDAAGSRGKQSALLTLLGQISNVPRASPNASIVAFGVTVSIILSLLWRRPWPSPNS
ncbi:hypothetical protein J3459_014636 [Metarhizium acridum]|uniref:Phosphotransferase enzyme family protein n=1 Tax=Metarhizium acridum (strain CQMa 102) TaxID=655827 RepID=E9DXU6_METAQ|nr:phosphotransferase enzyme family protein [Metarhizium acridum CQMa 102]EFY91559.1 phosphotransferase enzyme family protein [Metarhizium acridum CQMa 102]KAG8412310.1 hypothetical protein J3458_014494 [Metarhizium acridum]KAG8414534.1 hypothetical protein J3459_014636 [Metarhizium acridum]